jgi:hypothetical protein
MASYQANSYRCTIEWIDPAKPTRFQKSVALVASKGQDDVEAIAYYLAGFTTPTPGGTTTTGTPQAYAQCISPNLLAGYTNVTVIEISRQESAPGALAVGGTPNP